MNEGLVRRRDNGKEFFQVLIDPRLSLRASAKSGYVATYLCDYEG